MANPIALFDARRSAWSDPKTGQLTREAQIFLRAVWDRIGGATGASNNDLSASQFEDAGIEEIRATALTGLDALAQMTTPIGMAFDASGFGELPPAARIEAQVEALEGQVAELIAQLAEAMKEIQALKEAP